MSERIKIEMELFQTEIRRLANGNKLKLIFEMPHDVEVEAELIHFRFEYVKAVIKNSKLGDGGPSIMGEFEVFALKVRPLANGHKLRVELEMEYREPVALDAVRLLFKDCNLEMVIEQQKIAVDEGQQILDMEEEA